MKKVYIIGLAVIVVAVGAFFIRGDKEVEVSADPSAGAEIDYASDVIGSRVGTTTASTYFFNSAASSTYKVGVSGASQATFTVLPTIASTTGALATFAFYGSNDWDCITASTTGGTQNPILTSDINWYDIGNHVAELAGTQAITGTSTVSILSIAQGLGTDIVLSNLNYQCIKVEAHGSSTYMLMQVRL